MPCSVPVNCPAVICLPFMPCCLSKESTSSELWTPVQSLPLIHPPLSPVYLMQNITFHTICLILCYHKPVSLTTSLILWGKVLSLCCAGLRVACNSWVTFPSSFWFDNLGLYWGKTCCCAHHTLLLGFPTKCSTSAPSSLSHPKLSQVFEWIDCNRWNKNKSWIKGMYLNKTKM